MQCHHGQRGTVVNPVEIQIETSNMLSTNSEDARCSVKMGSDKRKQPQLSSFHSSNSLSTSNVPGPPSLSFVRQPSRGERTSECVAVTTVLSPPLDVLVGLEESTNAIKPCIGLPAWPYGRAQRRSRNLCRNWHRTWT